MNLIIPNFVKFHYFFFDFKTLKFNIQNINYINLKFNKICYKTCNGTINEYLLSEIRCKKEEIWHTF